MSTRDTIQQVLAPIQTDVALVPLARLLQDMLGFVVDHYIAPFTPTTDPTEQPREAIVEALLALGDGIEHDDEEGDEETREKETLDTPHFL